MSLCLGSNSEGKGGLKWNLLLEGKEKGKYIRENRKSLPKI